MILAFPNPISWAIDKVTGFVGDLAADGFQVLIGGLTAWVLDAVVWVVGGVFRFFVDATDPNVQADWFTSSTGPYGMTATIAATLLAAFVLAGVAQGALAGDVAGMLRRLALEVPMAVVGIVGLVTVTQVLIRLTDELSTGILGQFGADVDEFTNVVASLSSLSGGAASAFVIFLLGLVSVLAGIVLVAELVVRAALIYVVVALAPLVLAAQLWPSLKGSGRRALELLAALILSKLVIAVALGVASAAIVGAGSGGEVTALPAPEVVAEDAGGSVTQAVGILLAAVAAFGVAAFSPMLIARLLPITEAAVVSQGIKGGPLRSAQQASITAHYARGAHRARLGHIAAGGASASAAAGPAAPAAAAASAAASAGNRASTAAHRAVDDRPPSTHRQRRQPPRPGSESGDQP